MNDLEIFQYEQNQIKKLLQSYRFEFSDKNIENLTNDLISTIAKIAKKHSLSKNIRKFDKNTINKKKLLKKLKRFYLNYLITTLFRSFSEKKQLTIVKQLFQSSTEDGNISFDSTNNVVEINGNIYQLEQMNMSQVKSVILLAVMALYPTFSEKEAEEFLSQKLKSKKFSSLNKTRVKDNMIIEADNVIYPYIIIGVFWAYKNAKKTWKTAGDSRVRPTHQSLGGTTVGINQNFNVGGAMASFPRQLSLPVKEKVNCRCYLEFGFM